MLMRALRGSRIITARVGACVNPTIQNVTRACRSFPDPHPILNSSGAGSKLFHQQFARLREPALIVDLIEPVALVGEEANQFLTGAIHQ